MSISKTGIALCPHKISKKGDMLPYPDHIHVRDSRPSVQGCLKSNDLLDIHREWRSRGLDIAHQGISRLSRDVELGDHVCSFSMELFNLHFPGNSQLRVGYANSLLGPHGLPHFWMLLDSGLLSGFLKASYYLTKSHLEGFRVPASTQKAFEDMDPDVKKMFGYSPYHDWYNIMIAFAQLEIAQHQGKLDELRGIKGLIRLSELTQISSTVMLLTAVSSLDNDFELKYPWIKVPIPDISEFLSNSEDIMPFSEIMEKAKGRISMESLINYFIGKPKEEYQKLPEILSTGKLPKGLSLIAGQPIDGTAATKEKWDTIKSLKDLPSALLDFAARKGIKISDIEGQLIGKSIREAWKLVKDLAIKKALKSPAAAQPEVKKPEVIAEPGDPRLKVVMDLLKTRANWNKYRGDISQAIFAKDAGFSDLDEFYEFLNSHYIARRLSYTRTHIHKLDKVIAFWPELITWARKTKYPIANLGELFNGKTKAECRAIFNKRQKDFQKKEAERLAKKEKAVKEAAAKGIAPAPVTKPQEKKTTRKRIYSTHNTAAIDDYFGFQHWIRDNKVRPDELELNLVDFIDTYGNMSSEERSKAIEKLKKRILQARENKYGNKKS